MLNLKNEKFRNLLMQKNIFTADTIKNYMEDGKDSTEGLMLKYKIEEEPVLQAEAETINMPYINLREKNPEPEVVTIVAQEICMKKDLIVFGLVNDVLEIAMANPMDVITIDQLEKSTGKKIRPYLASRGAISRKINEYADHFKSIMVKKLLQSISDDTYQLTKKLGFEIRGVEELAEQAPIVKAVNLIILGAFLKRASDIHLLPTREKLKIIYRVDGLLMEDQLFPMVMAPAIISRLKVMAKLNITEKRMPQDGSFHIVIEGREIDFRMAVTPTIHGEKVVLRILDKSAIILGLDHLGINTENLRVLKEIIQKPNGIILISGPTGSGKTTTLYSALDAINNGEKNITTAEDPVEYEIEGITQIQIHSEIGLTFAHVLRSILRQDPDVVLIGEIRDLETTEIALRASLTGHLVFATVHTNDAPSAVTRLFEMGAEPYLIASSLRAVMSQRLVRTICEKCREEYPVSKALAMKYFKDEKVTKLYKGKGCVYCFNTGYRGRTVISELFEVKDYIRELIVEKAPSVAIKEKAEENGFRAMFKDGMDKVRAGITTIDEVIKVTEDSE
jgi:type II secretory ATPase GspE/PulE/Tfp pilus assembly ATPase PilB-like protein